MNFRCFFGAMLCILFAAISCKSDEIVFDAPTSALKFSKDTVFIDTVYHQIRSEAYAVKVYNQEDKDVMIPRIALRDGANSQYRINVDGRPGTQFTNVPLRRKDSLFIFVEMAPKANATEAIAEDKIQFEGAANTKEITLFSVVQDAEFFIESKTNPNIITENTVWDNSKAKVIFGKLSLAEGKTLTIQKGTKVYFTKNGSLSLGKNSTLKVNGELGNEVLFRGDRSDTRYDTIALNWKGISAEQGAKLNINYAKIFGGETGILLNSSDAEIKNSIIHTFQKFGIQSVASKLNLENSVLSNCGEANLGIYKGGSTTLLHSTLANFWKLNSAMPAYALFVTNEFTNGNSTENGAVNLTVKNSIIFGERENAVSFKPISGQNFSYQISHSLLKIGKDSGFTFDANPAIRNSIKNEDPKFANIFTHKLNLRVKDDSPAKAKTPVISGLEKDIAGTSRTNPATIGAYQ
ncbi:hypothetical protein ACF3N7_08085 [Cruoricaptor ignavus]|uniref:hypothetical protein n=1 Tax=Cruoricaptor ignavus TaxID=1118202 RepID=UPI00370D98BC